MNTSRFFIDDHDPPSFTLHQPALSPSLPLLIACDHAGQSVPKCLDNLGLRDDIFNRHIGYDIGARKVSEFLSELLNIPAILANYSRLFIDLNRREDDLTLMRSISDAVIIPANIAIPQDEYDWRMKHFFKPYHDAIAQHIYDGFIAIHSFTSHFKNQQRDMMLCVMTGRHDAWSKAFIKEFSAQYNEIIIAENHPYKGDAPYDYTVPVHALDQAKPSLALEIRQDLINNDNDCKKWAELLAPIIKKTYEEIR